MLIYTTNEWKGHGKQNYYRNEDKSVVESWEIDSLDIPEWLKQFL